MSTAGSTRITPFLWFDNNAEEAVDFYLSVFPNSRRLQELRNPGGAPGPRDSILTITFELDGQKFIALNGGLEDPFNNSLVRHQLRNAAGDRPLLVEADGGRQRDRLRLAQGQVRPSLAGGPHAHRRVAAPSQGDAGNDADEEVRHCRAGARRAGLTCDGAVHPVSRPPRRRDRESTPLRDQNKIEVQ